MKTPSTQLEDRKRSEKTLSQHQVDHDVFIAEKRHHRAGIVELVHRVEVRHLRDVHEIHDTEVFHFISNFGEGLRGSIKIEKKTTHVYHSWRRVASTA